MFDDKTKGRDLEEKACALWQKYGLFLPQAAKEFFKELAEFLGWENLKVKTK